MRIPTEDALGRAVAWSWCEVRGCSSVTEINEPRVVLEGAVVLSAFLFIVASTIVSPEYRYYSALLGLSLVAFSGAVPAQHLIEGAEWRLILFLVGSMTLAYLLQRLGVFRYLSIKMLQASKGRPGLLVLYVLLLSWFLAMVVDEVTSVVYMVMLVLDIYRLTGHDVRPLLVLSVVATNVGSLALPVGNPIGIYMAFTVGLTVADFLRRGLPLSFTVLTVTAALSAALMRGYLRNLGRALSRERCEAFIQAYYANLTARDARNIYGGLSTLTAFLVTVASNDLVAEGVSRLAGAEVSPHALLSLTPYAYLVVAALLVGVSNMREALEKGVEWPSLVFFISLFMMGHSLAWTGVSHRIAYLTAELAPAGSGSVAPLYLALSAVLSAFLDNLSVVVAFTSVGKALVAFGVSGKVFWGILYGGVLGGNYTPIGSTANLVALAMVEKHTKVTWGYWLRVSGLVTTVQLAVALAWLFLV